MPRFRPLVALLFAAVLLPAAHAQPMRDVLIINPFDVKAGKESDCLAAWDKAAMVLRDKPGFKSARLLRASGAADGFVTVGVWTSVGHYDAAIADTRFGAAFSPDVCVGSPAAFRIVRELSGPSATPRSPQDVHLYVGG